MGETIKILFVDDEKNVLSSLRRLFMDSEYEILTAESGTAGLEILRQEEGIQVLLSDYRMPEMNGVDFLRAACEMKPDTVRIVLSGYADTAAVVAAINEGQIYKFIPKPWNEDELKLTIEHALERFHLRRKNRLLLDELKKTNQKLQFVNECLEATGAEITSELVTHNRALRGATKILDDLPVGVLGLDEDGVVVYSNRMVAEIFNASGGVVAGRDGRDFFPPPVCQFISRLAMKERLVQQFVLGGKTITVKGVRIDMEAQAGVILVLEPEQ
ncbi:response regulator [Trichloromonas sp.]|uniref:response regulator n=1 Tax=Trichloromonas sp. TaxID=3069249 RepID=UPI003D81326F